MPDTRITDGGGTDGGTAGSEPAGAFCCEREVDTNAITGITFASTFCKDPTTCRRYDVNDCSELGTILVNGSRISRYVSCFGTTTVTLQSNQGGSATITEGDAVGSNIRSVTIEPRPQPGFEFKEWKITYGSPAPPTQIEPDRLDRFAPVAQVAPNRDLVCGNVTEMEFLQYQQISQVLYTDGNFLYLDDLGNVPASPGYYGAGQGFYYLYSGNGQPSVSQCPILVDGEPTGGTGVINPGGGEEDNRLIEDGFF